MGRVKKKIDEVGDVAEDEVTLTEVAEQLGTSRPTAKRHLEASGHQPVGFGPRGVLVYNREEVESWLDEEADEDEDEEDDEAEDGDEEDQDDDEV